MTDDYAGRLTDRYNREARVYRELWAPVLRVAGLGLLERLGDPGVLRVLDVGAGVGALLPDLHKTFPRAAVHGVDRSHGMLRLAPAEYPRAVMDARCLGIASASVDLVLLAFMLFHLDEPLDAVREARRVLRPGGRVGTITWAEEMPSAAMRIWTECLDAHGAAPGEPGAEARMARVDAPGKLETLLGNAGFGSVDAWEDHLSATYETEVLIRMRTGMGAAMPRFVSLGPKAQAECIAEARRRMAGLAGEDFVARWRVVCAVGGG